MTAETRERVKRAAKDLCVRPNVVALALNRQRSMTVGLLTKDSYGRFTMPVMAGLAEAQVDEGISVFMSIIGDDPSGLCLYRRAGGRRQPSVQRCAGRV
jgi:LacI family transcriptional regulator